MPFPTKKTRFEDQRSPFFRKMSASEASASVRERSGGSWLDEKGVGRAERRLVCRRERPLAIHLRRCRRKFRRFREPNASAAAAEWLARPHGVSVMSDDVGFAGSAVGLTCRVVSIVWRPVNRAFHLLVLAFAILVGARRCPAPIIFRPGEGWTYEPVGEVGKWQRNRAKEQLQAAQEYFDKKEYRTALKAARRVVKVWPLSDHEIGRAHV